MRDTRHENQTCPRATDLIHCFISSLLFLIVYYSQLSPSAAEFLYLEARLLPIDEDKKRDIRHLGKVSFLFGSLFCSPDYPRLASPWVSTIRPLPFYKG